MQSGTANVLVTGRRGPAAVEASVPGHHGQIILHSHEGSWNEFLPVDIVVYAPVVTLNGVKVDHAIALRFGLSGNVAFAKVNAMAVHFSKVGPIDVKSHNVSLESP